MLNRVGWAALLLLLSAPSLQGCFLAPALDSARRAGLTQASREGLIGPEVNRFHQALFWGSMNEALGFVSEAGFSEVKVALQEAKEIGRIVDSKIESIDFSNESYHAEVLVSWNLHDRSTNLVLPYTAKQRWVFSSTTGWLVDGLDKPSRMMRSSSS